MADIRAEPPKSKYHALKCSIWVNSIVFRQMPRMPCMMIETNFHWMLIYNISSYS